MCPGEKQVVHVEYTISLDIIDSDSSKKEKEGK